MLVLVGPYPVAFGPRLWSVQTWFERLVAPNMGRAKLGLFPTTVMLPNA